MNRYSSKNIKEFTGIATSSYEVLMVTLKELAMKTFTSPHVARKE